MSKKTELLVNTVIIAIGKLSTQVISVFLLPLYTTVLSTQEYGTYDLLITISAFLVPIITLLMEEAMFRFLIDCKDEDEKKTVISQAFIYIMGSLLLFSIIIAVIGVLYHITYIWLFIFYLIANVLIGIGNAVARGLGKIKLFSICNVLTSMITIGLNIWFIASLKMGITGLLLSAIISNIAAALYIFKKLKIYKYVRFKAQDKIVMKKMVKYSVPLVPNSISWAIINLSDRLILSNILGTAANGVYSIAYKFPNFIDTIYSFFYTAWKESASKAIKEEDSQQFYNHIYTTLKNFLFAIIIGMIACLPFAFKILIKGDFQEAYQYIPILIISMYFSNMSGFYGGIFSAYKDTKIMGTTTIISAIINIVINLICIHFIGIWAAAISTFVAVFFVYLQRKQKIKKYVTLKEKVRVADFLLLAITLIGYYTGTKLVQALILGMVILYCIYINREIFISFHEKIKNKIGSK